MTDPLALLPLAAASRGGSIDDIPAHALVAAGLTLLQRSAPLVRALAGKRAAILLPTSPAFLLALAASEGRGAVFVNPLASPDEIAYQLADSDVGAVFTVASLASRLPAGVLHVLLDDAPRSAIVVSGAVMRTVDLGSHFALELEGDPDAPGLLEEAAVVYTSAMNGRALGAILTHRGLLANARATIAAAELAPADRVLAALPFSHLFGFVVSAVAPLLAGAFIATLPRFHAPTALEQLERGTTMFVGVPAMFIALLAALARRPQPFRRGSLRLCICGGAPLDPALQDRWFDATGVELRQGYGLTEASPVVLFDRLPLPYARGTLGTPYPGVEVAIRDPATFAPLPDGVAGEVCVRGETVFAGYVHAPDAPPPRGLEVHDGWLRTGDLAIRRTDGAFVFRGVRKAMFTRNGFNIYPREIERVVAELPGVESAAVSAVPSTAHENNIILSVTGSATEQEVRDWCARRLSTYKMPTTIAVSAGR